MRIVVIGGTGLIGSKLVTKQVVTDARAPYYGIAVDDERALVPGDNSRAGTTRFADWLSRSAKSAAPAEAKPEGA